MKRVINFLSGHGAEILLTIGAAAIAAGAGMIYLPVGLIVGGILAVAGAVLDIRSGGGDE